MRFVFSLLLFLSLLGTALSPQVAGAAASGNTAGKGKSPASQTGGARSAPSSSSPAATTQSPLERLIADLTALTNDEKRATKRDNWLALEEKFSALAAKSKGDTAAQASLYHARTREQLGRRSAGKTDYREAAARYEAVAKKYPQHAVASTALYRRAVVFAYLLEDNSAAVPVLEQLIKGYPQAQEFKAAQKLLAEAQAAAKSEVKPPAVASPAPSATSSSGSAQTASEKPADAPQQPGASSVTLKKITWKGKKQRAVITLELDSSARYEYEFVPPDAEKKTPARVYLDIQGAFPSAGIKPGVVPKDLAVTRIRTGHSGDSTRIMFDCDGIVCYAVSSPKGKPQTIQLEVSKSNDIKNGISVLPQSKGDAGAGKGKRAGSTGRSEKLMEQLGLTVQTIMIDAGHGGKDPGARANDIVEDAFTLSMAKRVGALLQKKGFTVLYTRSTDVYITLQDRPDIANSKNVDLFISIHANANKDPNTRGLEIYYLDMAKTSDAAKVAARENSVSVKNISDLQFILTDLMLSTKLKESHELATCVQQGILQSLRSAKMAAVDHGVRSAPFYVLMGARMPAILVEFGYITNPDDAANLKSEKFLQQQAEGLVDGILTYKAKLAKVAPR